MSDDDTGSSARASAGRAGAAPRSVLPPPVFPPGRERGRSRVPGTPGADAESTGIHGDAFVRPDDRPGEARPIAKGPDDRRERRRSPRDHGDALDPHVAELSARISALASRLRDGGEAALRVTPDMGRFEATLRAYCVGYLASRREGDAP